MKKQHFYKLGSITLQNEALYVTNDEEGQILAEADMYKDILTRQGKEVTPDIYKVIYKYCQMKKEKYDNEISSLGIPESLKELFSIKKKSKALALCKRMHISEYDVYLLIKNCSQIGFTQRSKFPEFIPETTKLKSSDFVGLKQRSPRETLNKVHRFFKERKNFMVHLFERGTEWHCFYNTYQDMEEGKNGHWENGAHLHYLSYLWPEYRKKQVWDSFEKRRVEINGVHISLKPFEIDPSEHYTISDTDKLFLDELKKIIN